MKKTYFILTLAFLLISSISFAQSVQGDWELNWDDGQGNSGVATLTIKASTYEVDLNSDGIVDVKGDYSMEGDVMTLQDTEGEQMCSGEATYKAKVKDGKFTMTRISDPCEGRGGPEGVLEFTAKK